MADEKAVVTQVESVDLATVKGIVLPSRDVTPMTRFHKLNIQHVRFRADRGHKVGWKGGKDLYMHANHQLDTLFMAAGAEVLINEIITSDDQANPLPANVFRHHFAAKIILPSGKVAQADCHKTWDLRSLDDFGTRAMASFRRRQKQVQEGLENSKAKWPKGLKRRGAQELEQDFWDRANPFLEQLVEDEMVERRVFGHELAEAGAKSRVIYDMTGLKMGVPKAEFEQDVWIVTSLFNVEEALSKMAGTTEGQQLLALVALAQDQAFGAMGGEVIPGGAEALKLLQAVQDITPGDVEKVIEEETLSLDQTDVGEPFIEMTVEIQPPDEEYEPIPEGGQELLDEMMADELGIEPSLSVPEDQVEELLESEPAPDGQPESDKVSEENYLVLTDDEHDAFTNYLVWTGYEKVTWRKLLKALFGKECTMGTINKLQAKIVCQYAKFAKDETAKGIHDDRMLKGVKGGRKLIAKQAYKMGYDIDEYLKKVAGKDPE